jgi:hypothetical protein
MRGAEWEWEGARGQAKLEETEKQEAIDKRIERFGKVDAPAAAQGMQLDLLEARQDAARDAEARMEAIVLYGVDTLSTKDCMEYFQEFGPSFVEWIDDSSRKRHPSLNTRLMVVTQLGVLGRR